MRWPADYRQDSIHTVLLAAPVDEAEQYLGFDRAHPCAIYMYWVTRFLRLWDLPATFIDLPHTP